MTKRMFAAFAGFLSLWSFAARAGEPAADRPAPLTDEQKGKLKTWAAGLAAKDEAKRKEAVEGLLLLAVTNGEEVAVAAEPALKSDDAKTAAAAKRVYGRAKTNPIVKLKTNRGEILIELYEDLAPNTVANFIVLAEKKFYDGITFHRCIREFMIQGGDPLGTGNGGCGYVFPDEIQGRENKVAYGCVAMANPGFPDCNGSQFFIVVKKDGCDWLDAKHTVFGEVIRGMDVVHAIEQSKTGPRDKPLEAQTIEKATVIRKRDHAYEVKNSRATVRIKQ